MRVVLWMGSVMVTAAAVIGASRLWAEDKEKKPAPRTRIGLVNLTYVIKKYDKYKEFQIEMKKFVEPFQQRDAELRAKLKELREQAENSSVVPTAGEEDDKKSTKEELEEKTKKIQRQIEDKSEKAKKKISKESDHEMKIIYLDIVQATQSYAGSHDLDLVLHYNDAITKEEYISTQNISRKLSTGALMPVYFQPDMDISIDIVTLLNQKMHKR